MLATQVCRETGKSCCSLYTCHNCEASPEGILKHLCIPSLHLPEHHLAHTAYNCSSGGTVSTTGQRQQEARGAGAPEIVPQPRRRPIRYLFHRRPPACHLACVSAALCAAALEANRDGMKRSHACQNSHACPLPLLSQGMYMPQQLGIMPRPPLQDCTYSCKCARALNEGLVSS